MLPDARGIPADWCNGGPDSVGEATLTPNFALSGSFVANGVTGTTYDVLTSPSYDNWLSGRQPYPLRLFLVCEAGASSSIGFGSVESADFDYPILEDSWGHVSGSVLGGTFTRMNGTMILELDISY